MQNRNSFYGLKQMISKMFSKDLLNPEANENSNYSLNGSGTNALNGEYSDHLIGSASSTSHGATQEAQEAEDFLSRLHRKHPNLSRNERRLCRFLKQNFRTKEISELTGQSAQSIEVARTRLRKKLELTGTKTSLYGYMDLI